MLVQFGNNWIKKIPLTAKLDSAYGLVQSQAAQAQDVNKLFNSDTVT